ncbi:MAG: efflux RND transporter permease subunit, partial [Polyangia bacterium]
DHRPTAQYLRQIRESLAKDFPDCSLYFQPADIVTQVLNFGLTSPIDVQIEHPSFAVSFPIARELRDRMRTVPGTADVHITQVLDYPTLKVDVDRERAAQLGLSQRDVATSMLVSLSSSSLLAPSYFLNPQNNVNYTVVVKAPLQKVRSVANLMAVPLTPPSSGALLQPGTTALPTAVPGAMTQTLGNVSSLSTEVRANQVSHYTVQRVLDIGASVEGRDLGSVASDINAKIKELGPLPKGMKITVRGQNEVMSESFRSLGLGLILAVLLVYCLMVVLYQSWIDPLIIIMAVPGAIVGILWMLTATHTTINVESLMGAIMAVGIAVSNSILLVNFANDYRADKPDASALEAALVAGKTRLRPVLMTALAMVIGMIPMALALGEAGEQNAPPGRAVIGGLVMATVVTLFVVPVVYTLLRKKPPMRHLLEERFQREKQGLEPDERHV